jgi:hypothetical protein
MDSESNARSWSAIPTLIFDVIDKIGEDEWH